MDNFGLDVKIQGMLPHQFMAKLVEKCEKAVIDLEYGKLTVSALKQLNNYSRLALDAEKYRLKKNIEERNLSLV